MRDRWTRRLLWVSFVAVWALGGCHGRSRSNPDRRDSALEVGTARQLLFDDALVESKDGFVATMNRARRTDEPVLRPEQPWEARGCSAPSVLEDGGEFKLWYSAGGKDGKSRLCYATSSDGIHWTRPSLGVAEFEGTTANNIVSDDTGSVSRDPTAPPEKRFKRIGAGGKYAYRSIYGGGARFRYTSRPPETWHYAGVAGGYSPDGIHWSRCARETIMPWYTDTENVAFWDDRIRKYVAYVRWNEYLKVQDDALRGSFDYRAIGRSESDDFENFPAPQKILEPDFSRPEDKDLWGGGLYDSAAVKYPFGSDAYFIFTAAYHHTNDTLDVQLATSRDGVRFTRWREPFVRLGNAGAFDSMMIYMGVGILAVGDEVWMYYTGYDQPHDQGTAERHHPSIGQVRVRQDGFVSQDAGSGEGVLVTRPFRVSGRLLEVNMDGSSRGWLKVEILDGAREPITGFSRTEADRLSGNDVHRQVTWKRKADLTSLQGREVRLRFVGQSVKLYAFQFHE